MEVANVSNGLLSDAVDAHDIATPQLCIVNVSRNGGVVHISAST
jgi:hypothetical protein